MAIAAIDLFPDVKSKWRLEDLYADIAFIERRQLKELEKTLIRGYECSPSPTFIASQIPLGKSALNKTYKESALNKTWQGSSLRTELSRYIYPLISSLLDSIGMNKEKKVEASTVAELLEEAGYKKPPLHILRSDLLNLESRSPLNSRDRVATGASHFCNEYKYSNSKLSFFRYQSETNLASESQLKTLFLLKALTM